MLYVVAGNHRQYEGYLHARKLPRNEAQYVSDGLRLAGLPRGFSAVLTGTYYDRKDWPDIADRLKFCQAQIKEDPF
jgi:hypothetical protein